MSHFNFNCSIPYLSLLSDIIIIIITISCSSLILPPSLSASWHLFHYSFSDFIPQLQSLSIPLFLSFTFFLLIQFYFIFSLSKFVFFRLSISFSFFISFSFLFFLISLLCMQFSCNYRLLFFSSNSIFFLTLSYPISISLYCLHSFFYSLSMSLSHLILLPNVIFDSMICYGMSWYTIMMHNLLLIVLISITIFTLDWFDCLHMGCLEGSHWHCQTSICSRFWCQLEGYCKWKNASLQMSLCAFTSTITSYYKWRQL